MDIAEIVKDDLVRRTKFSGARKKEANELDVEKVYNDTWYDGQFIITDWKNPDYGDCEDYRRKVLQRIRADRTGKVLPALKRYYKLHPADFINDWGWTTDPRNAEVGKPVKVPFILFDRQREWLDFIISKWRDQERGLTEKSRDCGVSWLSVGLGCTLCLFYNGLVIGYGSRKREYVDVRGQPKALLWKARKFMENLPPEFNGGYDPKIDAPSMRIQFRQTESTITGEVGESIGRGDRASIYFVDEAAYLENPAETDAALSATTNCQQDISSVHGMGNTFAVKRHSGKVPVFVFDWKQDPRKDDAWYEKQCANLDETIVAQEIDRDYLASVENVLIPSKWVRAAIDAHEKLGVKVTGPKRAALDVADTGKDKNALAGCQGILIEHLDEWSGKGSDIFATTQRAMDTCDERGYSLLKYDSDGLGAGVRGDSRIINEERKKLQKRAMLVVPFRGSEGVYNPEGQDEPMRVNKDYFANRKAQGWMGLRRRFKATYLAVVEGKKFDPDAIISISSKAKNYLKLVSELSQPTYKENKSGKLEVDKAPDGAPSPNFADAVMIHYAQIDMPLDITPEVLAASMVRKRR